MKAKGEKSTSGSGVSTAMTTSGGSAKVRLPPRDEARHASRARRARLKAHMQGALLRGLDTCPPRD
eukprot:1859115-Prymnesium_polylepis.3